MKKELTRLFLYSLLLTCGSVVKSYGQATYSKIAASSSIPFANGNGLLFSYTAWGDYDNNGKQDLIVMGQLTDGTWTTKLYNNATPASGNGTFTEATNMFYNSAGVLEGLPQIGNGMAAWGDYDGDGLLDLIMIGWGGTAGTKNFKLYKQSFVSGVRKFTDIAPTSVENYANLKGNRASVFWGDYDNDGKLDFLIQGNNSTGGFLKIYHQENGSFIDKTTYLGAQVVDAYEGTSGIAQIDDGAVHWMDYDKDGLLDVLVTGYNANLQGQNGSGGCNTRLYHQKANGRFEDKTAIITGTASGLGVAASSVQFGDYDNDGKADFILSGATNLPVGPVTRLYHQELSGGNIIFKDVTNTTTFPGGVPSGVFQAVLKWGDVDNDGKLDFILTGTNYDTNLRHFTLYNQTSTGKFTAKTFTDRTLGVGGYSGASWADYNNDGKMDFVLTGVTAANLFVSELYKNTTANVNQSPSVPSGLSSVIRAGNNAALSWSPSTDPEIATAGIGVSYRFYMSATAGSNGVGSSLRTSTTNNTYYFNNLSPGTYYWGVQAIDNSNASSSFSPEQSFTVAAYPNKFTEVTSFTALKQVAAGAAVAWADFDNDGDKDFAITGSNTAGTTKYFSLYRNDGANVFTDITTVLPGAAAINYSSVKWVDYDNDGLPDLFAMGVPASGSFIRLYRQKADHTFEDKTSTVLSVFSGETFSYGGIGWGDYDNDGRMDFIIGGNMASGTSGAILYHQKTDGSFENKSSLVNSSLPAVGQTSVDWADYNNDGRLDFFISGVNTSNNTFISRLYRQDANGTFTSVGSFPAAQKSKNSSVWGDYDNDGLLDILFTSNSATTLYRQKTDGTFEDKTADLINFSPLLSSSGEWGDFDNDGLLDILLTGIDGPEATGTRYTYLYHQNADHTFDNVADVALPSTMNGLYSGTTSWVDYNNDGLLDFMVTGKTSSTAVYSGLYQAGGPAAVANVKPAAPASLSSSIAISTSTTLPGADVTLTWAKATDSKTPQDALSYNVYVSTISGQVNKLSPMANLSTGYRSVVSLGNSSVNSYTIKGLQPGTYYWSVQAIDGAFAGSSFSAEKSFTVRYVQFTKSTALSTGLTALRDGSVAVADYNNDNYPDLLVTGYTTSASTAVKTALFKGGVSGFTNQTTVLTAAGVPDVGTSSVKWIDYDNDGLLDFSITGQNPGNTARYSRIFRQKADGSFEDKTPSSLTALTAGAITWGDYDNDGRKDFIITGQVTSVSTVSTKLFRQKTDGSFEDKTSVVSGLQNVTTGTAEWADYNGDGRPDFILRGLTASSTYSTLLFKQNTDGSGFTEVSVTAFPSGTPALGYTGRSSNPWGDYNNDGFPDLLLMGANSGGRYVRLYLNNQDGTFTDKTADISGLTNTVADGSAEWADYDNDGKLDFLIMGGQGSGSNFIVQYFRQSAAGKFVANADAFPSGMPVSAFGNIAPYDFNNDGILDFVIGGQNLSGTPLTEVYTGAGVNVNTAPSVPSGLASATPVSGTSGPEIKLTWAAATDDNTIAAALKYNINIRSADNLIKLTATDVNKPEFTLRRLTPGTYKWSVLAVDGARKTSASYSAESEFTITQPKITAFSPMAAAKDATVTITGTGFNTTAGKNTVFFGAVKAVVTAASATELKVTVPAGATHQPISVLDADMGLTGYSDIPFISLNANAANVPFNLTTLINKGSLPSPVNTTTINGPREVAFADINSDDKPDLIVTDYTNNRVSIYRNIAAAGTAISSTSFDAGNRVSMTVTQPQGVSIGDLDGDSRPDIAVASAGISTGIAVARNTSITGGAISFDAPYGFSLANQPLNVVIADINSDGRPEIISGSTTASSGYIVPNISSPGTFSFDTPVSFPVAGISNFVAAGDFNKDGKTDLAFAIKDQPKIAVYQNNNLPALTSSSFSLSATITTPGNPYSISTGDLDKDGNLDIVSANLSAANNVSVIRNAYTSGNTISFGSPGSFTTGSAAGTQAYAAVGDIDGDGRPDIAAANYAGGNISVLRNISAGAGNIGFATKQDYVTGTNPYGIAIGDLDRDGRADLVVTNVGGNNFVFLRNRNGALITLDNITKTFEDADFDPAASSNHAQSPVSYASSDPAVATIVSNKIHITGAGTATITATQAASTDYASAEPLAVTLTINKKKPAITFSLTPATKVFGDADSDLSATEDNTDIGAAVAYTSSNTSVATIVNGKIHITGAGTTVITASLAESTNYQAADNITQTLTVNKKQATLDLAAITAKTYGDADFSVTATPIHTETPVTYSSSDISVATVNSSSGLVHILKAGTVTITASQAESANYLASDNASRTLTINKQLPVISFAAISNKTYGDAPFSAGATENNTDAAGVIVYSSNHPEIALVDANTGLITIKGTGTVSIKAVLSGTSNYLSAEEVSQSFTVSPKMLTVTADPLNKKYGEDNPALTFQYAGFVYNETAAQLTTAPVASTTAIKTSAAGTYPVTLAGGVSSNYTFDYHSALLTVLKNQASITFTALPEKTYGAATFSAGATGNHNEKPVTYTSSNINIATVDGDGTIHIKAAGSADITASLAASSNYEAATAVAHTLVIKPAALTITADNKVKKYKESNPVLSASYLGFVYNDNAATLTTPVTLTTTADQTSAAGNYYITAGNASSPNYEITFQNGTLRIDPAVNSITFGTIPVKTYGDADFNANASSINTETVITYQSSNTAVATVDNTGKIHITGAGTALITAAQPASANYEAAVAVNQTVTVQKASPVITLADFGTKFFDSGDFIIQPQSINTEKSFGFSSSNTAVATIDANGLIHIIKAGSAVISVSQDASANYNAAVTITKTLVIDRKTAEITFNTLAQKTFNDADFTPGATSNHTESSITYSSNNTAVATIVNGMIHIVGAGTATITAAQDQSTNYLAAVSQNQSLTVNKDFGVISFDVIPDQEFGNPDLAPGATANHTESTIIYSSDDSTVATITSDGKIHITGSGTTTIRAALAESANYLAAAAKSATLSVGRQKPLISFNDLPVGKTYGDLPFTASAADNNSDVNTNVTFSSSNSQVAAINANTGEITINGAGEVVITAHLAASANFSAADNVQKNISIAKASLTATAVSKSKVYGQDNPVLTVVYTGFQNGDTEASIITKATATTTALKASPVGQYVITPAGAADANYDFSYVNGNLDITKATLTATAENKSKVYGQDNPALTVVYTGFQNGDTEASIITKATATTTALKASPVGQYVITPAGAADANYDFSYVNGSLDITKATLTATAENKVKVYGDENPALTVIYTGFQNCDTEASITTKATATTTALKASPVGQYVITPAGAADANYDFSYVNGGMDISKATLTATAENKVKVYGDENPELTIIYTGFVNGDTRAAIAAEASATTTADKTSPVGQYVISAGGASDENYDFSYTEGSLDVTRAMLTATADNKSKVYGEENPVLSISYTGFINGDTEASLTTKAIAATSAVKGSPVGQYIITASGAADTNYDFTYVNGSLDITKAMLTATAGNQSKVYGQDNPALTVSYSGFVNGDTEASVATKALASTIAVKSSPAGQYVIVAAGAADANYNFTYVNGTLDVNKAVLIATADNKTKVYGQDNPALTVSYTGFVNGDTESVINTPALAASPALKTSAVGFYNITASAADDENYSFTYVNGALEITKAMLTAAADNKSKVLGSDNPLLTVSYSGFVNGDTEAVLTNKAIAATQALKDSPVGQYIISPGGASDINYDFTYVNGALTITRAMLTVTANNKSKIYGEENPVLTLSYSGFMNGDTEASLATKPTAVTAALKNSPVGQYTITAQGAVDLNYSFSYVNGTLDISKAALTATADNKSKVYGQDNPALSVSYSGFVNGDTEASLVTKAVAVTTALKTSPAGQYPLTVGGAADANYTFTYVPGNLDVSKAVLTATADNKFKVYGQDNPALSISYSGFVNGDTEVSLATRASATTAALKTSPSGQYPVVTGGAADANYSFNYVNGTLEITKATVTATADNQSRAFGQQNPPLTVSYTGFVNGDTEEVIATKATAVTTATASSAAGLYDITVNGADDENYQFSYVKGSLTVTSANSSIAFAAFPVKTYGDADFDITVNSIHTETPFTFSSSNPGVATVTNGKIHIVGAGSASITVSQAASNNYVASSATQLLSVGKVPLTIKAENKQKIYGQDNPVLTATYSGFVNGDSQASLTIPLNLVTAADKTSGADEYVIQANGASSENYVISFETGKLTIAKAPLIITAEDKSRNFNQDNPEFTLRYSGFVNTDNAALLTKAAAVSTAANISSEPGIYDILVNGAESANYSISYVPGKLEIFDSTREITFNSLPEKTYGDADFNAGATVNGNETLVYSSSNTGVAQITAGVIHITGAGKTTITVTLPATPFREAMTSSQELTVNKASQKISFAGQIPVLKRRGDNHTVSVSATSGLPVKLVSSNLWVASTDQTTIKPVGIGVSKITASQEGNENYLPADEVSQEIEVVDPYGEPVILTKLLTPNADDLNSVLIIEGITNFPENKMTIFNRNGTKIFETSNYNNGDISFNGRDFRGNRFGKEILPPGTYFYSLVYKDGAKQKAKSGFFVIKY